MRAMTGKRPRSDRPMTDAEMASMERSTLELHAMVGKALADPARAGTPTYRERRLARTTAAATGSDDTSD